MEKKKKRGLSFRGIFLTCVECSRVYRVKRSHQYKSKACSRLCISNYYKRKLIGDKNPNFRNAGLKTCLNCRTQYESYSKSRKFCTYSCACIASRGLNYGIPKKTSSIDKKSLKIKKLIKLLKNILYRKRIKSSFCKIMCSVCGKEFYRRYVKMPKTRAVCSFECRRLRYTGVNNPNYKDGRKDLRARIRQACKKSFNAIVLKRDNYTCRKCFQVGGNLNVDHIYPFSKIFKEFLDKNTGNDDELFIKAMKHHPFINITNLQTLCRNCNLKKMTKIPSQQPLI